MIKTGLLFFATALAEIIGCFLPYLWLRKEGSPWLLLPAALSLVVFVWLRPCIRRQVAGSMPLTVASMWQRHCSGCE